MKHELAMVVVVVVAIGTVGVTVAVGSAVKEPTVVSNPYEAGLHHREAVAAQKSGAAKPAEAPRVAPACDLAIAPCVVAAGPYEVRLDLGPRPLRTMAELAVAVELRRDGAPVDGARVILAFDMRDMSMGENRRTLAGAGAGRYTGKAVLVRCPSGRRDWYATVVVGEESAASTARFDFRVEE
jgi:nitrogen fixation protein FixH